jgi:hypothetical protein
MAELKTTPNEESVQAFLDKVEDEKRKADCLAVLEIMRKITGEEPKMCGKSMVGFGSYHYKYDSGREGDWFLTGFSPRKQNLTLYIMAGFEGYEDLMQQLGKYKTGKSCLYLKKLEDVDQDILVKLIEASTEYLSEKYGS